MRRSADGALVPGATWLAECAIAIAGQCPYMGAMTAPADHSPLPDTLPHSYPEAAMRGIRGQCPRCGKASLFRKWLKVVDECAACQQDWSHQRADDFPAYVSLFITGHVMAPLIIWLILDYGMSDWLAAAIGLPMSLVMAVALIQPAKGATVALLWWMGMHGFRRERPLVAEPDPRQ